MVHIPIARPDIGQAEKHAVLEVLGSGQLSQGPKVQQFEQVFARFHGARFGVATSSGTTALMVALLAHEIGPGDEVIVWRRPPGILSGLRHLQQEQEVVHDGGGERPGIESVHHPAMAGDQLAGVLHAQVTFHGRLDQVAHRDRTTRDQPQAQALHPRQAGQGIPEGQRRDTD